MALFLLSANLGWIQGQFNFTEDSLRYPEKPIGGNVREELRMEVESPFHEPETVEHHGLDKLTVREVVARLGDRTVNDRGDIGVSKAPATIPRWPIEMLDPSMKAAEEDIKCVNCESTQILRLVFQKETEVKC